MLISYWSSDVCSSDLTGKAHPRAGGIGLGRFQPSRQAVPVPVTRNALQRVRILEVRKMAMRLAKDPVNIGADAVRAAGRDGVAGGALLELRLATSRACGGKKGRDGRFSLCAASFAFLFRSEEHTSELQSLM